jgi:hypothetical protein
MRKGQRLINALTGEVGPGTQVTGYPTNQELASLLEPIVLWATLLRSRWGLLWWQVRCVPGRRRVRCASWTSK